MKKSLKGTHTTFIDEVEKDVCTFKNLFFFLFYDINITMNLDDMSTTPRKQESVEITGTGGSRIPAQYEGMHPIAVGEVWTLTMMADETPKEFQRRLEEQERAIEQYTEQWGKEHGDETESGDGKVESGVGGAGDESIEINNKNGDILLDESLKHADIPDREGLSSDELKTKIEQEWRSLGS